MKLLYPIMVRLSKEEKSFIKVMAKANNWSEAEVMRRALKYFIEENYQKLK